MSGDITSHLQFQAARVSARERGSANMASAGPSFSMISFAAYVLVSAVLSALLFIDPLFNSPSGLIKLSWFTRTPVSHGVDACSWDYEGSWRIGFARGNPDPRHLSFSAEPVITCATLANATAVSFVADPFLFIPELAAKGNATAGSSAAALLLAGRDSSFRKAWYAFYEMKNLRRFIGELGVAVSYDQGATWRHLGTALQEPFHLSYPLVMYDTNSSQYLMFAETSGARDGAVRVYGTSRAEFPFGWRVVAYQRPEDPGWPATRRWYQFGAAAKYVDTAPVWYGDRWWIFTTRVGSPASGQPKYTLLLYTADTLLGEWKPHPRNLAGAPFPISKGERRVPFGIDASSGTGRNGGRPFVLNGTLYRWAQDCSHYYGEALVLMRADVANAASYDETVAVRYDPNRDGRSWRAQRLHHADMHQLPNGSWIGLADGDRFVDGRAHFIARELWFLELKATLRWLVPLQLTIVVLAVTISRQPYIAALTGGWKASLGFGSGGLAGHRRLWSFDNLAALSSPRGGGHGPGSGGGGGLVRKAKAVGVMVATAVAVAVGLMTFMPWTVYCPRWPIAVRPLPGSPHFVPEKPYVDPHGPYNVSTLAVVTGCSSSFVDRLENLVASMQYWSPRTRLVVYDIGFTSQQLAEIRCWSGIELRRFPWERFPPHVRELQTYAFKPLTFQLALEEVSDVVLWLDCGLEVRGPLTAVVDTLSRYGHVSAQQSTSPGSQGDPPGGMSERYTRRFLNLTEADFERVKMQPFCAGGFQGYVRGSAAHQRILQPVVSCSLHPDECLAPPGHSRGQHCYDQTALTLMIRHNNFSSCLPRELFATSSTRKTSYDPRQGSAPIVVASRRYRKPKPYRGLLRRLPGCVADPAKNPWVTVASEHIETTISRASLKLTLQPYAAMIPDIVVQISSCLGLHILIQLVLWAQVSLAMFGVSWRSLLMTTTTRRHGTPARHVSGGGAASHRAPPPSPLWIASLASALTAVVSMLLLALAGSVT